MATKELAHRRPLLLSLRPGIVSWIPVDRLPAVIVEVARGLMTTRDHSAAAAAPAGTKHKDSQAQVCHAVDPATVRWSDLVGMVQQALQQKTRSRSDGSLSGDYDVKIVSFEEWLGRLRYSSSGSGNHKGGFDETDADAVATQKNPGLNYSNSTSLHYCRIRNLLLPLLPLTPAGGGQQQRRQQGLLARLDLTKTIEVSQTLASLEAVESEWVSGWVDKWIYSSSSSYNSKGVFETLIVQYTVVYSVLCSVLNYPTLGWVPRHVL